MEKQQAYNVRRIRQERLFVQRGDIIQELNTLDLNAEGEKGERIEKLLHMIKLSMDLYKDAQKGDEKNTNGTVVRTQARGKRRNLAPAKDELEDELIDDEML